MDDTMILEDFFLGKYICWENVIRSLPLSNTSTHKVFVFTFNWCILRVKQARTLLTSVILWLPIDQAHQSTYFSFLFVHETFMQLFFHLIRQLCPNILQWFLSQYHSLFMRLHHLIPLQCHLRNELLFYFLTKIINHKFVT